MHKQRLGIVIAAAAGMLGVFLPWVTVPFLGSVSGISAGITGWLLLILFGAALAMTLSGDKQTVLTGGKFIAALILGALSSLIAILNIINYNSEVGKSGGLGSAVSLGIGIYVIVLAGIAVVVLGFVLKKK